MSTATKDYSAGVPKFHHPDLKSEYDPILFQILDALVAFEESMGDVPPENWAWRPFDPKLLILFKWVNDKYFGGRVQQPNKLFWFDSMGILRDISINACDRTMGFTHALNNYGTILGINIRLKADAKLAVRTLRHEMCHLQAGHGAAHGPVWRQALRDQSQGDEWCEREVAKYKLLETGVRDRVYELLANIPSGSPWVGSVCQLRQLLGELNLTNGQLNSIIDGFTPHARALVLRAMDLNIEGLEEL